MRTVFQDHQLADLGKDLLRSNRYLSPDKSKTWRSIIDPTNVSPQVFDQLCNDLTDHFLPQTESDFDQSGTSDKLQTDDLSKGEHQQRRTRIGRAYLGACIRAPVRPMQPNHTQGKVSAGPVASVQLSCLVKNKPLQRAKNHRKKILLIDSSHIREFDLK